jgi:hypothetical protein
MYAYLNKMMFLPAHPPTLQPCNLAKLRPNLWLNVSLFCRLQLHQLLGCRKKEEKSAKRRLRQEQIRILFGEKQIKRSTRPACKPRENLVSNYFALAFRSLDTFRGMTIALMIFVNDGGETRRNV